MTLVEDCSDKIFTYNIYITIYTIYIRGNVSMYIIHLIVCVRDVSFVIDGLLVHYTWHKIGVKCFIKFFLAYIKESS